MSFAKSLGNYLGNISGEIDVIRRSQPSIYRNIMQVVGTLIVLVWINIIISTNVQNNIKKNQPVYTGDVIMKRILSLPMAIIVGWLLGFLAEMSVHAQLAQAKQNCLYKGFKENTPQFQQCLDNVNFHLQNKNDLLHRLN